jgi:hypothetical protein
MTVTSSKTIEAELRLATLAIWEYFKDLARYSFGEFWATRWRTGAWSP